MKITVREGDREITVECAHPYELDYLSESQIKHLFQALSPAPKAQPTAQPQAKAEVPVNPINTHEERLKAIAEVLRNEPPITAVTIANELKDNPFFNVPGGNPVHAVRRLLKNKIFAKTNSGQFTLADRLVLDHPDDEDFVLAGPTYPIVPEEDGNNCLPMSSLDPLDALSA